MKISRNQPKTISYLRVSTIEQNIEKNKAEILDELEEDDNVGVSELSRLERSMLECMEILSIATQKETNIHALKGNWKLNHSIQSKIVAMAFSTAVEIEREFISQGTKEALRVKKLKGVKLSRKDQGKVSLTNISQRSKRCWQMAPLKQTFITV